MYGFHKNDIAARVGFCLHEADVYISELNKAAQQDPGTALTHPTCMHLLRPWIQVLQNTQQPALLKRIKCAPYIILRSL
jgi:hypothetical protein